MYGSRLETAMNLRSRNLPSSNSCRESLLQERLGSAEIAVTARPRLILIDAHQFVEHQTQRLLHFVLPAIQQQLSVDPSKPQPLRADTRSGRANEDPPLDVERALDAISRTGGRLHR